MTDRRRSKKHPARRRLNMREAAMRVVRELQSHDYVALFAGGCVRDMLMGLEPHDYDVATSATPDEVLALFRRTQKVGAKFGVVLVRVGRHSIEVATFRTDLSYDDGRHPVGVVFSTPKEDAARRDFTINGMFFDPITKTVIDHVGGQSDLDARLIRAIGDADKRFAEDHLRLLRAVRFSTRLDFAIEPETWMAICHHADQVARISPERIRLELEGILAHPSRAVAFETLHRSGLLQHLWPDAKAVCNQVEKIVRTLSALPSAAGFELSLVAVLKLLPVDPVKSACGALRCSNSTQQAVVWLVRNLDAVQDPSKLSLADLKRLMAHEAFDDLLALLAADRAAAGNDLIPLEEISERVRSISPGEVAPPPLLTGKDLGELQLAPGPRYKEILDRVYTSQLSEEICDREAAIAMAKKMIQDDSI